ncbi:hypothetical protein MBLNU459_g7711t1 [Dothideomycetes sp. NU459]
MDATHDELISQFCAITGVPPATAQTALSSTEWDLEQAVTVFYASQDAPADALSDSDESDAPRQHQQPQQPQQPQQHQQHQQAPPSRAPSQPKPASSSSSASRTAAPPQSRMRTIRDLQNDNGGSGSDSDEDPNQDFFAGGEKSALAVQNPNRPTDHFRNILNQAKENRSRPGDGDGVGDDDEAPPSGSSNFTGRAQTLGGDEAPSQVIDDPRAAAPAASSSLPRVERTLHLWQDGFSIDDGPLHRFDDPANAPVLALINQGRAPLALLGVQPGQEVDLNLDPHKDQKFVQPKKKYKPFGGSGQRLGSPTPGPSTSASAQATTPATSSASAAAAAPPPTSAPSVTVDETQPTLTLQIRLGDGSQLRSRFNTTHTVGHVYDFVNASAPASTARPYALMTTFPSKELSDKALVLGDMADFKRGGVVVQKWT